MLKPPNSKRSSLRQSRHQDDRIVLLTALGTVCGLAGWLFIGGFPAFQGSSSYDLVQRSSESTTIPHTLPSSTSPTTSGKVDVLPSDLAEADESKVDHPAQRPAESSEPDDSRESGSALPPLPPLPEPTPDSPAINPTSEPDTGTREPLQVPAPQVPMNGDRLLNASAPPSPLVFTDVSEGFWAKPYIDVLTARGVVSGLPEGRFEPNRPMTRAEFAAQIASAFEIAPRRKSRPFTDLAPDYWANPTIQAAVKMGFMTGYPNGEFQPNVIVTRLQVLTALATGLSLPPSNAAADLLVPYQDAAAVPDWATQQVASAIVTGIITPSPTGNNQLRPNDPATRAEVAALMYNTLVYMGQIEPITP